jgi:hypothetical protein
LPSGGELRDPWDGSRGEVSVGVRHAFVRLLIQHGLLVLMAVTTVIILLGLG